MKPTQEQIKEFWEWCSVHYESYATPAFPNQGGAWEDKEGNIVNSEDPYEVPAIDLNNLFKWAVPSLKESCEEWWSVIVEWAKDITGNYEKDTLALFWAIRKVIKED